MRSNFPTAPEGRFRRPRARRSGIRASTSGTRRRKCSPATRRSGELSAFLNRCRGGSNVSVISEGERHAASHLVCILGSGSVVRGTLLWPVPGGGRPLAQVLGIDAGCGMRSGTAAPDAGFAGCSSIRDRRCAGGPAHIHGGVDHPLRSCPCPARPTVVRQTAHLARPESACTRPAGIRSRIRCGARR
jgi:hypothetical protein